MNAAAEAIGDVVYSSRAGTLVPDGFTHGTETALPGQTRFDSGDPAQCWFQRRCNRPHDGRALLLTSPRKMAADPLPAGAQRR